MNKTDDWRDRHLTEAESEIVQAHLDELAGRKTCRRCAYYSDPESGFCDFHFEDDFPGDHTCKHWQVREFPGGAK